MKTYAIADLHGRFDLLEAAIAAVKAREPEGNYIFVFTGDYVDRGPTNTERPADE